MSGPGWDDLPQSQVLLISLCFQLGIDFLWRGPSELLIPRIGASRLVDELEQQGVTILGFEGFELVGEDVHPRIDLIYDAERAQPGASARSVIASWPSDVWVELVLGAAPTGHDYTT